MNLIFHSSYCEYSVKLIDFMDKSGESTFFNKVNVDIDPVTKMRPDAVKMYSINTVPTLIIDGYKVVGEQAFKWLSDKIKSRSRTNSQKQEDDRVRTRRREVPDEDRARDGHTKQESEGISQIPEDGKLYKNQALFGDVILIDSDIDIEETDGGEKRLMKIREKKDGLKAKQIENEFAKLEKRRKENDNMYKAKYSNNSNRR